MVSPDLQFKMLAALVGAIVSIAGVWFAGVRRGDKSDARILALEKSSKAQGVRVEKLWDWFQRERGKSERSDVRSTPSNPGDTRG